jgi:hypothetical protein
MPDTELVQPESAQPAVETATPSNDLSWIDTIGHHEETAQPRNDNRPVLVPVPIPYGNRQPEPQAVDPIVGFVRDIPGTIRGVAQEVINTRVEEEVKPLREAMQMMVRQSLDNAIETAVGRARDNLRAHVSRDPSVANDSVAREVNRVYSGWIRDAAQGDARAIAALANPDSPATVVDYVRRKSGNSSGVQYRGGTMEGGSTVAPSRNEGLSPEQEDLAIRWGAQLGKDIRGSWAKNEADSERYLRQR